MAKLAASDGEFNRACGSCEKLDIYKPKKVNGQKGFYCKHNCGVYSADHPRCTWGYSKSNGRTVDDLKSAIKNLYIVTAASLIMGWDLDNEYIQNTSKLRAHLSSMVSGANILKYYDEYGQLIAGKMLEDYFVYDDDSLINYFNETLLSQLDTINDHINNDDYINATELFKKMVFDLCAFYNVTMFKNFEPNESLKDYKETVTRYVR